TAELQVCPVKKWITQCIRNRFGPLLKFLSVGFIAGAIGFIYSIGAHGPPLIMITIEPGLGDIGKLMIFGHLLWRQVTMVIDNGHSTGILMVKPLRGCCSQQEMLIQKLFHTHCLWCLEPG